MWCLKLLMNTKTHQLPLSNPYPYVMASLKCSLSHHLHLGLGMCSLHRLSISYSGRIGLFYFGIYSVSSYMCFLPYVLVRMDTSDTRVHNNNLFVLKTLCLTIIQITIRIVHFLLKFLQFYLFLYPLIVYLVYLF